MNPTSKPGSDNEANIMLKRSPANPIITPEMVKPSRPDFKVDGTFNAGVTRHGNEIIMLVRIAESVISANPRDVVVPTLGHKDGTWSLGLTVFQRDDPAFDFSDPEKSSWWPIAARPS